MIIGGYIQLTQISGWRLGIFIAETIRPAHSDSNCHPHTKTYSDFYSIIVKTFLTVSTTSPKVGLCTRSVSFNGAFWIDIEVIYNPYSVS